MTNSMPSYTVFHFRTFMGHVSAVSLKQAKARAAKRWPAKRLEVELALNVPTTERDRLTANLTYQAKRSI